MMYVLYFWAIIRAWLCPTGASANPRAFADRRPGPRMGLRGPARISEDDIMASQ